MNSLTPAYSNPDLSTWSSDSPRQVASSLTSLQACSHLLHLSSWETKEPLRTKWERYAMELRKTIGTSLQTIFTRSCQISGTKKIYVLPRQSISSKPPWEVSMYSLQELQTQQSSEKMEQSVKVKNALLMDPITWYSDRIERHYQLLHHLWRVTKEVIGSTNLQQETLFQKAHISLMSMRCGEAPLTVKAASTTEPLAIETSMSSILSEELKQRALSLQVFGATRSYSSSTTTPLVILNRSMVVTTHSISAGTTSDTTSISLENGPQLTCRQYLQ